MWTQTSTTRAWLTIHFSNLDMHNVNNITQSLNDPRISKWVHSMREWYLMDSQPNLIPLTPLFLDNKFAEHVGFLGT